MIFLLRNTCILNHNRVYLYCDNQLETNVMKSTLSTEQINRIKSFYKPIILENSMFLTIKGNKRYIRFDDIIYYLTFGEDKTVETSLPVSGKELYYHLSPDSYEANLPDERTLEYIQQAKVRVGYLGFDVIDQDTYIKSDESVESIQVWMNSHEVSDVKIKKEESRYVVQYTTSCIDSFESTILFFSRKPSVSDIRIANILIFEIELHIYTHPNGVYFNCIECGKKTHWLDGTGENLAEKWNNFITHRECRCC